MSLCIYSHFKTPTLSVLGSLFFVFLANGARIITIFVYFFVWFVLFSCFHSMIWSISSHMSFCEMSFTWLFLWDRMEILVILISVTDGLGYGFQCKVWKGLDQGTRDEFYDSLESQGHIIEPGTQWRFMESLEGQGLIGSPLLPRLSNEPLALHWFLCDTRLWFIGPILSCASLFCR